MSEFVNLGWIAKRKTMTKWMSFGDQIRSQRRKTRGVQTVGIVRVKIGASLDGRRFA